MLNNDRTLWKKKIFSPSCDIALLVFIYLPIICIYYVSMYNIYRYKQTSVYFDQYKIMLTRLAGIHAITQGFVKTKKLFTLK